MSTDQTILPSILKLFRYYKTLAEKACDQLSDAEMHFTRDDEDNSIAIIMKHMAGNMISRWTDFLSSDGEKSWRNRENEFVDDLHTRIQLFDYWNKGWKCLFDTLDSLSDEQLQDIVYIRNEGHTVLEAIQRQLAHYAYHVGQIVFQAKTLKGKNWVSLSIPKGESKAFNADKFKEDKGRKHFV